MLTPHTTTHPPNLTDPETYPSQIDDTEILPHSTKVEDSSTQSALIAALHQELKVKAAEIERLKVDAAEKDAAALEEKRRFGVVIEELKMKDRTKSPSASRSLSPALARNPSWPADPSVPDPLLKRDKNSNVLSKNIITNNCTFKITVHDEMHVLKGALFGEQKENTDRSSLYQEVLEQPTDDEGPIVFWSYLLDLTKSCDLILRLQDVTPPGIESGGVVIQGERPSIGVLPQKNTNTLPRAPYARRSHFRF